MRGQLRLSLLGSPTVHLDDKPVGNFRSNKTRALLYYLAATGQTHQRPALAGLLWGGVDERYARRSLNQAISNLRRIVGGYLSIGRESVACDRASNYWLDVSVFERGTSVLDDPDDVAETIELYRGDFLAGFHVSDAPEFEQWVLVEQARLRELALRTLNWLVDHHDARQEGEVAIHYARRMLALEPWREETHRRLMLMLARSGQRSSALAQFQSCQRALADELAIEPDEATIELFNQIRAGRFDRTVQELDDRPAQIEASATLSPPFSTAPRPHHRLPTPPTPFIGRAEEVAAVRRLIHEEAGCRMLTLVGPGGMGKTRLAIEVASGLVEAFRDGLFFVELASISAPAFIVSALAEAMALSFQGSAEPKVQLLGHLQRKQMLLIVDNFEHLLEGADLLSEILATAPDVRLLVTSRERLNLQEEWSFNVQGMEFPEQADALPDQLETYAAIDLFVQCARRTDAPFAASNEEMRHIVHICRLMNGIPLGIELAAAWAHALSCQEIAEEIEHNLDFLSTSMRNVPARHRSLRAVFEQTWQRLAADEQAVMGRLSVFRGGCTRAAAAAITGATLPLLTSLVDKGLVRRVQKGRYDMHELLRQFAASKLEAEAATAERVLVDHSRYFAGFAEKCYVRYLEGHYRPVIRDLGAEIDNMRAAWQHLVEQILSGQGAEAALACLSRFIHPLAWFYRQRARYVEGKDMFHAVVVALAGVDQSAASGDPITIVLAQLQIRLAMLHYYMGEYEQTETLIAAALPVVRAAGRIEEEAVALEVLAKPTRRRGEYAKTKELAKRSLALFRKVENQLGIVQALTHIATTAADEGDYALAEQTGRQIVAFYRQLNDTASLVMTQTNLANTYIRQGKYLEARPLLEEVHVLATEDSNRFSLMMVETNLALVARNLGNYAEAQAHNQVSLALARDIGNHRWTAINLNALSHNALGQHDWDSAGRYALEALALSHGIHSDVDTLANISCLAHAWARQGKPDHALRALLYVDQHPSTVPYDKEQNAQLLHELRTEGPPDLVTEAEAWCRQQSLDEVVDWIARTGLRTSTA